MCNTATLGLFKADILNLSYQEKHTSTKGTKKIKYWVHLSLPANPMSKPACTPQLDPYIAKHKWNAAIINAFMVALLTRVVQVKSQHEVQEDVR